MGNFYKSYVSTMEGKQFRIPQSRLGAPTHPGVAKQLEEFGKLLNQGIKNIEIGTIDPTKFEFIPQQHFDEIRRLAKITDSHVSVHGPLMDLAGFPEQGGGKWSEDQRKGTEQQLYSILERSFKLSNGENVPVVFHSGHFQSQEYEKGLPVTIGYNEEGKPIQEKKDLGFRSIVAVNQDSGEITRLEFDKKKYLGEKGEQIWDPMRRLHSMNATFWDREKQKVLERQKEIQEIKEKMDLKLKQNEAIEKSGLISNPEYQQAFFNNSKDIKIMTTHIENIHQQLATEYQDIYDRFERFGSDKAKEVYKNQIEKMNEEYLEKEKAIKKSFEQIKRIDEKINTVAKPYEEYEELTDEDKFRLQQQITPLEKEKEKLAGEVLNTQVDQNKIVLGNMGDLPAPKLWRWVGEFSIDKTAETVSNAIARMYVNHKKEGREEQIPFIALENFFVNSPMSTAEDLKSVVEKSRELLAKKLKEKAELSESEAKKTAEKLIGATWDVGHINNLRKAGFEGEELKKKVLEETKKIAEVTKHVHITDNFGFHDSHLPPGMGNVPISEIMEQLEKKWSELREKELLGQEPRAIVEAGGFVAEIGQNPTLGILEYFGSPLYKISPSPYFWGPTHQSIAHTYTRYMESFIEFPQQHFNLYGSSFTTLPKSVGGQVGEGTSRFAGTPNQ